MTIVSLPDASQVVRWVRGRHVLDDGSSDGAGFLLRENEQGLSIYWLDRLTGTDKLAQLAEVRRLIRLQMKGADIFAELNVGGVKEQLAKKIPGVDFVHRPLIATSEHEEDPSHSEIAGLPPNGSPEATLIGDMIAECVQGIHPALLEAC